jgi:hypothetical protein
MEHDCLRRIKRAIVPGRVDARQGEAPDGANKGKLRKELSDVELMGDEACQFPRLIAIEHLRAK